MKKRVVVLSTLSVILVSVALICSTLLTKKSLYESNIEALAEGEENSGGNNGSGTGMCTTPRGILGFGQCKNFYATPCKDDTGNCN